MAALTIADVATFIKKSNIMEYNKKEWNSPELKKFTREETMPDNYGSNEGVSHS